MDYSNKSKEELIQEIHMLKSEIGECMGLGDEYRKARDLYRDSEDKVRIIHEQLPLPYNSLDENGYLIEVNHVWLETLGYERKEVLGRSFKDFLTDEGKKVFEEKFPIFKKEGKIHGAEYDFIKKDGSTIRVIFDGRVKYDDEGNFKQTYCIFQDITERRVLEQSAAIFKRFANNPGQGFGMADFNGKVFYVNPALREIFGEESEKNAYEKKIIDYYPKEYHEKLQNEVLPTVREKGQWTGESIIIDKDGKKVNVIENIFLVKDEDDKPLCYANVITDITDCKKAENELKKQQYYFTKAQEMGGIATWELDITKNDLVWTPENYRIFGVQKETPLTYEIFLNCVHPDDREYVDTEWKAALKKKPYKVEHRLLVNGEVKWVTQEAEMTFDETGKAVSAIGFTQDITERKKAEEELRTGKEFSDNIIKTAQTIILVLDPKGRIVSLNPYMEELSGYRLEEVRGKDWFETFLPKEDYTKIRETFARSIGGIHTRGNINPIIAKDGRKIEVEWYDNTIKAYDGSVEGLLAIGQDITDCKKAEEAREEVMQRNKALVDALGQIVYEWRPITNELIWEGDYTNLLGYSPQEMGTTTESWTSRIHPDDLKSVELEVEQATRERRNYYSEYRFRHRDGSYRWMRDSGIVSVNPHGELKRIVGVFLDITENKKAEEKIVASEKSYKNLFNSAAEGILVADAETKKFIYANPRISNMLGYEEGELIGKSVEDIHPKESLNKVFSEFEKQTNGSKVMAPELPCRKKNGEVFYANISTTVAEIDGRNCAVGFFTDVTERKTMEKALQKSEIRYKELFENMKSCVAVYEAVEGGNDFIFKAFNKAGEEAEKIKKADVLGKCVTEVFPGVKEFEIFEAFRRVWKTGTPENFPIKQYKDQRITGWRENYIYKLPTGEVVAVYDDVTERIKAAEDLKRSEEYFRAITENSSDIINILDKKGTITYASISAERFTGYSREEVVGQSVFKFIHPADRARAIVDYGKAILTKSVAVPNSFRILHKDGSERIFEGVGKNLFDDPSIKGFVMNVRDVTEQKKAEQALRESEERFRRAVVDAPFPVIIHAENGEVLEISGVWTEITGYTHEEIPTISDWTEKAYGWRKDVVNGDIDNLYKMKHKKDEGEYVVRTKTGEERTWEFSSSPIGKLPDGRRLVISMANDVTERKKAEKIIRDLAKFPEENPNPVMRISREGVLLYANKAGNSILKEFGCIGGGKIPEHCWDIIKGAVEKSIIEKKEMNIQNKVFLVSVTPIADVEYVNLYWLDITDRVKAREELELYKEHLEELVKERTVQLTDANKELESFSYSVSHDLRAPLRAIGGFSNILTEDYSPKLDDHGKHVIDVIKNNTSEMERLIEDLLSFSRLGRQSIKTTQTDITSIAKEEASRQQDAEKVRKIKFKIKESPKVEADSSLMRYVLVNLISNAVKFTKEKDKALIEFGGKEEADQNVYYIKDNGVGFNEEYKDKLFDVFQRLHPKEEYGGTGVGLAIVAKIVKKHGGHVWAEGKIGEGATFYFSLPRKR